MRSLVAASMNTMSATGDALRSSISASGEALRNTTSFTEAMVHEMTGEADRIRKEKAELKAQAFAATLMQSARRGKLARREALKAREAQRRPLLNFVLAMLGCNRAIA